MQTVSQKKKLRDKIFLNGEGLSTTDLFTVVNHGLKLEISEEVEDKIEASHDLLNEFIKDERIIYGVNTSLGGFVNWLIPKERAGELQNNLIAAVATNVGPYLEEHIVKASMIARLNSLARGCSGISLENYKKLLNLYNSGIIPCIPSKGSLGASGDLGPLACIALVGTGKWKAKYKGKILRGDTALKRAGLEPMELSFKEGLSLINGTSTMVGLSACLVEETKQLIKLYDVISSLSFEGLKVKSKPFNPIVHRQKPHKGQLVTAENIWKILKDSQMIEEEQAIEKVLKTYTNDSPTPTMTPIEDAYSIRCTPHIVGPIRDTLKFIEHTITNELNSSNDNPLIIPEEEDFFHNGHFHGQYISMAMDQLSIALTTLSNLSDRRIDRFMDCSHSNSLPGFLCRENPGVRLGLMGGQFMASSLTSESRSLCHPVSTQSLTSTGDFQDIVSLGLVAARRAKELYENTTYVVAFELLCGCQAADIRGADQLSSVTKKLYDTVREVVPYLSKDEPMTDYLEELSRMIKSGEFLEEVEKIFGEILL